MNLGWQGSTRDGLAAPVVDTENEFLTNNHPSQGPQSVAAADGNHFASSTRGRKNVIVHAIGCSRHLFFGGTIPSGQRRPMIG